MWSFLNPVFLYAAGAAIIPLVLHLMQRRRTVRMPFSTIRFLKLAQKRSSNRIRIENLLLWLLRTLLMLVIVSAFAVPVIRTTKFGRIMGQAHRDVAIVLDVSYSMTYETGQRRVWNAARDAAIAILRGMQNGDRVCVFLAGDQPTALIEKPTADLAMVQTLIQTLEPRPESSRLVEVMPGALNALKDSKQREREVYVLTDGQAQPWAGFSPTNRAGSVTNAALGTWNPASIDKDIVFFAMLAGPRAPENCWPFEAALSPAVLMSNTIATLTARIAHNGPAMDLVVTFCIDDQEVGRRTAAIDANGIQTVSFPLPSLSPGMHTARIATPPDGLTMDDTFHAVIRVRQKLPTLCVGSEKDALFLLTALNAGQDKGLANVTRMDAGELNEAALRAYSSVFLVNALPLPGQAMLALESYVKNGGTLAIFPGDNANPAAYQDWSILPAKPDAIAELEQGVRVRQLRLLLPQDPLFAGFALPPGSIPTLAIRRNLHWSKLEADSTLVTDAGDDAPFLASRYVGKGRVLLCAVSADRRWSTLPMTSFFLPMVYQIVQFGAGLVNEPLYLWTTANLIVSDIVTEYSDGDQILMPNGKSLSVRSVSQGTKVLLEAENAAEPGVYALSHNPGEAAPAFALNLGRAESNLDQIDAKSLAGLTGLRNLRIASDVDDLQRQIDEHRRGRPLTETFFWLALLLAIAEWWMANQISRNRSSLVASVTIQASGRVGGTGAA